MKYYVVLNGRKKGIFTSWDECMDSIHGYKNALYKSFLSYEEALSYQNNLQNYNIIYPSCYIDGSFNNLFYSYGVVLLLSSKDKRYFKQRFNDSYLKYHNVSGEIKASMFIIDYCIKLNIKSINIYYDYLGIEYWYNGLWKANSDIAKEYVLFSNFAKEKISVNFYKVKSHSNNYYNDLADKLAKEALDG